MVAGGLVEGDRIDVFLQDEVRYPGPVSESGTTYTGTQPTATTTIPKANPNVHYTGGLKGGMIPSQQHSSTYQQGRSQDWNKKASQASVASQYSTAATTTTATTAIPGSQTYGQAGTATTDPAQPRQFTEAHKTAPIGEQMKDVMLDTKDVARADMERMKEMFRGEAPVRLL
jgi:hypothetical protein